MKEVQEGDAIQVGGSQESVNLPGDSGRRDKVLATPAVRRIAGEYNIDLRDVTATGKDGRVSKEDILNYVQSKGKKAVPPQVSPPPASPTRKAPTLGSAPQPPAFVTAPSFSAAAGDRKEPIKGYTKAMIKTMTAANVS